MKQQYLQKAARLMALEYNCRPEDFFGKENVITLPKLQEGRRRYSEKPYFFHMGCMGSGAVITADESLHPFLRDFAANRPGHWLFELPNLLPLQQELSRQGYCLTQTYHMFLPAAEVQPKREIPVRWYYDEQIHPFYGDERFPNAIGSAPGGLRPDRIALCAMDGETIMGMAGASQDAPGWMQIGIDVMAPYRSQGIASYLVTLLKNEILRQGQIPFYGTSLSNYHSWNTALKSGFFPAWVEIGASKKEE